MSFGRGRFCTGLDEDHRNWNEWSSEEVEFIYDWCQVSTVWLLSTFQSMTRCWRLKSNVDQQSCINTICKSINWSFSDSSGGKYGVSKESTCADNMKLYTAENCTNNYQTHATEVIKGMCDNRQKFYQQKRFSSVPSSAINREVLRTRTHLFLLHPI